MTRYDKKQQLDNGDQSRTNRFQRRHRGHKTASVVGASKQDRRHGWGYAKRRAILTD